MNTLNSKHIYVTAPPVQPVVQTVSFCKPLSYEFRVAEHLNDNDVIERVGLQVQIWEHDEYGAGNVLMHWHDVQRVKLKNGTLV
jgi:hypothetical protein